MAPDQPVIPELPPKPSLAARLRAAADAVLTWFWANIVVGLLGVWVVGQVFRDRSRWSVLCFLVPSVAIAAALLATAPLARLCRCRRLSRAALVLALLPLLGVCCVENRWIPRAAPAASGPRFRLVHWNVAYGKIGGWASIAERLRQQEADVYVLSEVGQPSEWAAVAAALGPEYRVYTVRALAILARGPVRLVRAEERVRHYGYLVRWDSAAGPIHLFLVDLPAAPIYDSHPLLAAVRDHIARFEPDLTVGDFNVSRRTRALSRLPRGYSHAYDRAGVGWSGTFPARLPLWDIDQCIVGPRVVPLRYRLRTSRLSDHRMQVLDFALAPSAP